MTVNNKKIYMDENISDKFNHFETACSEAGIILAVANGFRPTAQQSHFYGIKNSSAKADIKDCIENHKIIKTVNPPGSSFHEVGLAVDLNVDSLTQYQKEELTKIAKEYGFYKTVSSEPWHFGYAGKNPGDNPRDSTLDKDAIAKELGYTSFSAMYKEDQKDYKDKGNTTYTCPFGNKTGL